MSEVKQEPFSKTIVVNKRKFYMDVRETRDHSPYLVISTTQRNEKGEPQTVHIYVFADQFHAFHAGFEEAATAMIARLPSRK